MEIVANAFSLIQNAVCEFILFAVVDGAVKFLQNTRSQEEKEMIWKLECIVLAFLVAYVWWTYHVPYILLSMFALALWFTLPTAVGNFRRWWLLVKAKWEEFEQLKESMGRRQQQPRQLPDTEIKTFVTTRPPLPSHQAPPTTAVSQLGQRPIPVDHRTPLVMNSRPPSSSHQAPSTRAETELRQRPFPVQRRPPLASCTLTSAPAERKTEASRSLEASEPNWLKQVANRAHVAIWSALGQSVRRCNDLTPPGLNNPGQNVCFLNAIIQAIAHTPCLPEAVLQLWKQNPDDRLIWHFGKLLEQLSSPVVTGVPLVLDTLDFRMEASSEFPHGLIEHPVQMPQQRQQDAAECLAWIIEWLHSRMSSVSSRGTAASSVQRSGSCQHRHYSSMVVESLKQRYDVHSSEVAADQRAAAIRQIEHADGTNTAEYIGSLNVVSEIDWYRQSSANSSAVNDLFMGQMVDMRLCDACHRVAVSTQLFHILPVPIEPQQFHGYMSLDSCLKQFARVEQMGGANGLICDHCNRFRSERSSDPDPCVAVTPVGNHVGPLSPICGGGGGNLLSDSVGRETQQQRTSTPIQSHVRPSVVTDCRRRSLVGYLPSCLVIQLMRFTVGFHRQSTKVSLPVIIPLNRLDMSPYVLHNVDPAGAGLSRPSEDYYNLYAVCLHLSSDSTTNGHYIAYARCGNEDWYRFDDDHVRAVNMEYELTTRLVRENAYLLFYERSF